MANMGINFACSNVRQQIDSVLTSSNLPVTMKKYILMDLLNQYSQLEEIIIEKEKDEYLHQLAEEREDNKENGPQHENTESC